MWMQFIVCCRGIWRGLTWLQILPKEKLIIGYYINGAALERGSALESLVIDSKKHELIRAAYLFYYASEVALYELPGMKEELKIRLNELINDALVLAKNVYFPVPICISSVAISDYF